ncbi:DUF4189 domain-containing protein [Nocardia sp. NPDC052566]|uniref:DUF4189 domain-containing protein n=1 Tax=Nocardia sp. NPDC052566 TaxID=3364330 RepID=UPI0037C88343
MSLSDKAVLGLVAASATVFMAAGVGTAHAGPDQDGRYYGAIAVDNRTGTTGAGWNYSSWDRADARALSECGSSSCVVLARFVDGCGSIAESSGRDGKYAGGVGATRAEAERKAIEALGPLAPPFPNFGSSAPKTATILHTACTGDQG